VCSVSEQDYNVVHELVQAAVAKHKQT
jgi:hypothetical protein